MQLTAGMATDVGRVRHDNEDCALVGAHVFAVADGMGGHAAGEVASALAVAALRDLDATPARRVGDVQRALEEANDAMLAEGATDPGKRGMGTTATGIAMVDVLGQAHWAVFNIGDSRVYRLFDGDLARLTTDHSRGHVLTRSLGVDRTPTPDLLVMPPAAGERFLMCSDGLTNELDDAEIAHVLSRIAEPGVAADELVRRAVEAGGRDNATAVVVDVAVPR
ncbi:PP2C family protein-serine/threonine phosphatase [Actinosynnema pretiosum]|uniref:Protein phosphatase n=1 Tax=Actinosynnema pretiosum TaxID=42197 RepID=A0A290Z2S4_9PSEU|nr:protein phosphatase 2C domain-containing protein [Actinosynnema pretiosum]ATE53308.1 protein phosphatase [Actinosynnema pretiosum]